MLLQKHKIARQSGKGADLQVQLFLACALFMFLLVVSKRLTLTFCLKHTMLVFPSDIERLESTESTLNQLVVSMSCLKRDCNLLESLKTV